MGIPALGDLDTLRLAGSPRDQGPFRNLETVAMAAASAFTAQAFTALPPRARRMTAVVGVTTHASSTTNRLAARLQWQVEGRDGVASPVYEQFVDGLTAPDVSVPPYGRLDEYSLSLRTPAVPSVGAAATFYGLRLFTVEVPSKVIGARVLLAEVGDTTNRASAYVDLYTSDVLTGRGG